ncbi:transient receptor potential cation channel protein painless [Bombus terrestris]|uniref:Transient receptor potential cation channel protein painless n=1 Tax=Bombus terrestris TaxID=30195 RepID=A0A9B0F3G0_BOMTE|nr:transient receptor potential cation channel protein painless [Bombus terrestris]XP_012164753.2 transient receptor potential cation channel protein painless [Bombus terrestris]
MDPEDENLQMHLLHDYTTNSTKSQIIYRLLLDYLRTKNIKHFKCLVEQSLKKQPAIIDVNYAYPNRSNETCLDIACKNGLPEFVKFLLEKGAKVNRVNEAHNRGPIHFATENGYADVLSILLDERTINPNLEAGQQTALHMAVKKNDLNCASLLLEKGASPNIPNVQGLTALHKAAMKGQKDMVNLILERTTHVLNLDTYKDYNHQTTREVLEKKLPNIQLPPVEKQGVNVYDLKYYLNANDEMNFLKCLEMVENEAVNNVAKDLIEMAVERNFKNAVITLLKKTRGTGCNLEKAANLAVQQGLPHILREILETDVDVTSDLLLNACIELGIPNKEGSGNMEDRLECLNLILEREDVDVRCTDSKGNTPLHYAARADCREAVTLLLEKGSYIGHMNNFGVPPVEDISVSTLSQYFDNCIQARKKRTNEYTIEFDYKCLVPHDTLYTMNQQKNTISQGRREMDVFQYIAGNSGLKHILKHPLLSSFLYLKWHRIRHILHLNLAFYILFYLLLNTYILQVTYITRDSQISANSSVQINEEINGSTSIYILHIFTGIVTALLAFREILQLFSSPCHYVCSLENWIEIVLIILGFVILSGITMQVATIVILLSALEMVILLGKHPRMSTGIEMFKKVSLNFVRFLLLYVFLILGFAFSFFIILKDDNENFSDPGHSLFKTIIMFTGEFNSNDIVFVSHSILNYFIFIFFIFFIAIVLFNLLNGLAVSDTAEILEKAELVGLISRIQVLAYIENLVVRAPFTCKARCSICYGFLHGFEYNPLAFLVRKVLLFPTYLSTGKLSVEPYDILFYHNVESDKDSSEVFPAFKMDPYIMKQAKDVLLRKGQESNNEKIFNKLDKLEKRFATMEIILSSIKQKIENNNFNVEEAGN